MAIVYEYRNGVFGRNNNYEVDKLTVDEAIDAIIDATEIEGKVTYSHEVMGYGDNAILVSIDGEPYVIIGDGK